MAMQTQKAWQDDPEEETRSYVERIRELVERGDVRGARALVTEAVAKGVQEDGLESWQRVLAPARILGRRPADEPDRTREFGWLKTHGDSFRGQWVALLGDDLLAHSSILKEVTSKLAENPPPLRPLLYWIPEA